MEITETLLQLTIMEKIRKNMNVKDSEKRLLNTLTPKVFR